MSKCPIIKAACPKTDTCPCWTEIVFENAMTGETKIVKDCLFRQLPLLMVEVIKASNRPAAAIESTRNQLVHSLGQLATIALAQGSADPKKITYDG